MYLIRLLKHLHPFWSENYKYSYKSTDFVIREVDILYKTIVSYPKTYDK